MKTLATTPLDNSKQEQSIQESFFGGAAHQLEECIDIGIFDVRTNQLRSRSMMAIGMRRRPMSSYDTLRAEAEKEVSAGKQSQ
ncbi:MAG: hypothetical protein VX026_11855, partial [Myxococcota bacterium]|nr:hypothetical protein [Myxococcota bacterium]